MVPATGPWALVGQSASYLIKLAPLLWWALPSSQLSKLASEAISPSPGIQYTDTAWKMVKEKYKMGDKLPWGYIDVKFQDGIF
ncbi:hypothetical protein DSO57_1023565 [Entomophthora muscae]|uniref:Uncharacterized protein n=1 Tax=Entomophthora muscae TaxID=34485 RepID=A0ACC2SFP9_9FUNG|nr:hypothetical protein DSO57_1023565 [Entomophthora muscae]